MKLSIAKVCVVGLLAASMLPAATIKFFTVLEPEVPGATGAGNARFVFDTTAQTLTFDVDWWGLSGKTTVAHIHCCVLPPGTTGVAVAPPSLPGFPVGVTEGSYDQTVDLTLASSFGGAFLTANGGDPQMASAALLQGIFDGKAYLNIHSETFRGGEIRGFLTTVPEPGTSAMAGIALFGLAVLSRWKRHNR
jgi:hypothetical protein